MDKYLKEINKRGVLYAINPKAKHFGTIEQSPWELAAFSQWVEDQGGIGSYMEIGVSNGGTLRYIVDMFKPRRIYAADINKPKQLPPGTNFFHGSTFSPEFKEWIKNIGYVDLILIDADHKFESVTNDYEICKQYGKHIAFHDICGLRDCAGSAKHWNEVKVGKNHRQFVDPNPDFQVGIGLLV